MPRPRGKRNYRRFENEPRANERIRIPRILLIDENGEKLGEFVTKQALALARERGLDLVEIAPTARPPVCKITDLGKLKYDRKKKENEAKKRRHQMQCKEIKLRPKTDQHDMNVKIKRAQQFLADGNKVKVTVRYRGREHAHHDIGAEQCMRVAEGCNEVGQIEHKPAMEGRQMVMILAPA